jgi:hypothetical protein
MPEQEGLRGPVSLIQRLAVLHDEVPDRVAVLETLNSDGRRLTIGCRRLTHNTHDDDHADKSCQNDVSYSS